MYNGGDNFPKINKIMMRVNLLKKIFITPYKTYMVDPSFSVSRQALLTFVVEITNVLDYNKQSLEPLGTCI